MSKNAIFEALSHPELKANLIKGHIKVEDLSPAGKITAEPETWAIDYMPSEFSTGTSFLYDNEESYNRDLLVLGF